MQQDERAKRAIHVTLVGSVVNIILTFTKLLVGIFGNSAALVADGVHSLSDLATDILVIIGFRIARRPSDEHHEYGHGKVETLVTVFIGAALSIVGAGIFYSGMMTLYDSIEGTVPMAPSPLALLVALLSVFSKEAIYRYTVKAGKELGSDTIIANAWHHRSDAFSSIGTFFGIGGAIALGGRWVLLDPLAAILVSIVIVKVAIDILIKNINELIDCSIDQDLKEHILMRVERIGDVIDVHDMRTRKIGSTIAIELHISVDSNMDLVSAHDLTDRVEDAIKECCGSDLLVTVHVDPV